MCYKKKLMSDETPTTTAPPSDEKKEQKLNQLALARAAKAQHKRKREDDLKNMTSKLLRMEQEMEQLKSEKRQKTELKQEKKQELSSDEESDMEPERPKKRGVRVTKEPANQPEPSVDEGQSWTTSIVRSTALVTLAGLSFYFNNLYGKGGPTPKKKTSKAAGAAPDTGNASGFAMPSR